MQIAYTTDSNVIWSINCEAIDKDLIKKVLTFIPDKSSINLINFNKLNEKSSNLLSLILKDFFMKDERSATQGNSFSIYPLFDVKKDDKIK